MSQPTPPNAPAPGSHYQPATWAVLVIITLFVASAFAMLRAPAPAGPATTTSSVSSSTTSPHSSTTLPSKARVRVQVANGTKVANLARTFSQRLLTLGWDTLPPVNANSPAAATTIYFTPGYLWAAKEVATSLKVSRTMVQPLNGLTPVPGASADDVIVVLGPDVATQG